MVERNVARRMKGRAWQFKLVTQTGDGGRVRAG